MTLAPGDLAFALHAFRRSPFAGPDMLMDRVVAAAREALAQCDAYEAARKSDNHGDAQIAAENAARILSKAYGNSAGAARAIREYRNRQPEKARI